MVLERKHGDLFNSGKMVELKYEITNTGFLQRMKEESGGPGASSSMRRAAWRSGVVPCRLGEVSPHIGPSPAGNDRPRSIPIRGLPPFLDGNGRVGRLLITLFPIGWKILPTPAALPLSIL
jgi:hypothetical protein